jgi:hypothetical protein
MQVEINLERPQEAVIHFHIRGCPLATLKLNCDSSCLGQFQLCSQLKARSAGGITGGLQYFPLNR